MSCFAGVSQTIVEELQRAAGTALHLPNALDLDSLDWSSRTAARRELGLPGEGVCIGVIGRLHYKKNPELALDAFRLYAERYGPAHLAVVGDGDLRQRLETRAQGLPATFTGFVRDPRRLFRAFDAILLTSGARAFPIMVALEAMAAGVPVVSPRLPDATSVLGSQGFYFESPEFGVGGRGFARSHPFRNAAGRAGSGLQGVFRRRGDATIGTLAGLTRLGLFAARQGRHAAMRTAAYIAASAASEVCCDRRIRTGGAPLLRRRPGPR